jgi:enoyl-CoA hydratase
VSSDRVDEQGRSRSGASASSGGPVRVHHDGPVTVITIDRPASRNAVDGPTAELLVRAFEGFDRDPERNVAVLSGAGGTFCAGADLKAVATGRGNRVEADMARPGPMGPTRMELSKPVLAAIEGHAVAGGLELAIWCDLRIAAADAVLGVFCRRWGVPLVDGGTVRLPRLVGHGRAMDLILTGRPVGADEALAIGLVDRVVPTGTSLAAALELAHQLAALPQQCLRSDRIAAIESWSHDHVAAMANETTLGLATIRSGETLEGAARFAVGAGRHGRAG